MALVAALVAACPQRFDPAAAPVVTSPDRAATAQYERARQLYTARKHAEADRMFSDLVAQHPADPLARMARLYRGRIALEAGQLRQAVTQLRAADQPGDGDGVARRARYYLGLALVRQRHWAEGRRLLTPFVAQVAAADRPPLLAALGQAARGQGDLTAAVSYVGQLHRITTRAVERRWARQTLEAIITAHGLTPAQLRAIHAKAAPESLVLALSATRLAQLARAEGQLARSQQLLDSSAAARKEHAVGPARATPAGRAAVGLLVPLSGRYRVAGREVLGGAIAASATLSAISPDSPASAAPLALVVRDSAEDPQGAARELARDPSVVALVGTLDPRTGQSVAQVAQHAALPFISLSRLPRTARASTTVQLLPPNVQRAAALSRHAARLGLHRVAVLAPRSRYGKQMADAFAAGGARVAARVTYPPRTRSFSTICRDLARQHRPDGVFVADSARALELIAPALAEAGLWSGQAPKQGGGHKRRGKHAIQLLATADGLSQRLVQQAWRYLDRAVLAPGFFADSSAPGSGPLVRRFSQARGRSPGLVSALGFDGVQVVRALLHRGVSGRTQIGAALRSGVALPAMTGDVRFGRDGLRADAPLLYQIQGQSIRLMPRPQTRPTR